MVCRYGLLAERLPPPTSHSWGALPRRCTASLHPGNCAHGTCYGQLALRWARMGSGPLRRVPGFPQGHRASRLARRRCRTTNCFRRATPRGFVAFSGRWTTARLEPLTPLVDVVPSAPFVFPRRSRQNLTLACLEKGGCLDRSANLPRQSPESEGALRCGLIPVRSADCSASKALQMRLDTDTSRP